jgi:hypothetical protein
MRTTRIEDVYLFPSNKNHRLPWFTWVIGSNLS